MMTRILLSLAAAGITAWALWPEPEMQPRYVKLVQFKDQSRLEPTFPIPKPRKKPL